MVSGTHRESGRDPLSERTLLTAQREGLEKGVEAYLKATLEDTRTLSQSSGMSRERGRCLRSRHGTLSRGAFAVEVNVPTSHCRCLCPSSQRGPVPSVCGRGSSQESVLGSSDAVCHSAGKESCDRAFALVTVTSCASES